MHVAAEKGELATRRSGVWPEAHPSNLVLPLLAHTTAIDPPAAHLFRFLLTDLDHFFSSHCPY